MSSQELPPVSTEAPVAEIATPEIHGDRIKSEFTHKLHLLRDELYADRGAEIQSYSFIFNKNIEETVYLPDEVLQLAGKYGEIESIEVQCTYLENTGGTTFQILFEYYDEDTEDEHDPSTFLVATRPYNYTPLASNFDSIYRGHPDEEDEEIERVHAIAERDLNRCLASMVCSSPDTTMSTFDSFNWSTADFNKLTGHFKEAATKYSGVHEYLFHGEDGGMTGSLKFEESNGDLTSTWLNRLAKQDIIVTEQNNLMYAEEMIETSVDINGNIVFFAYKLIDDEDLSHMQTEEEIDYQAAIDFIGNQFIPLDSH